MSIEDQFFLSTLGNQRETNLQSAKKKFKKKFAGEIPKTLQEYADANDLTLAQANKELIDRGVRLQNPKAFRDIKREYDATRTRKDGTTRRGQIRLATYRTHPSRKK